VLQVHVRAVPGRYNYNLFSLLMLVKLTKTTFCCCRCTIF